MSAGAGSIWAKRDKSVAAVYTDDTARQVGDVLTIIISESTKVDNKVNRDLKKTTDRSLETSGSYGYNDTTFKTPVANISAASNNQLAGQSNYKDERSFDDRITVVVEDVQANGNLVVMGTRERNIAGDKQTIQVSGIVRTSDIAFDNTVKSEQVGNFNMVAKNDGVSDTYTKVGWLGKILDFIWPF
jgi:flagellar L-ring protein precursor FlgH